MLFKTFLLPESPQLMYPLSCIYRIDNYTKWTSFNSFVYSGQVEKRSPLKEYCLHGCYSYWCLLHIAE